MNAMQLTALRIAAQCEITENGCWEWPNSKGSYGQTTVENVMMSTHIVMFIAVHGYQPKMVCHHCDNPPCCNPAHLFPGDNKINMQDMAKKGRTGVRIGPDNHNSKLTPDAVMAIRATEFVYGTAVQLAEFYGVSATTIVAAKKGRSYKWLPMPDEGSTKEES